MQKNQNMTGDNDLGRRDGGRWLTRLFASAVGLYLMTGSLQAQEALRNSLAGENAARQRKISENIPYNVKMGPVRLRFESSLGLEYVDNINVSDGEQVSDYIVRPELLADAVWPITAQNTLNFSVGVGYSKYSERSENDALVIRPNSAFSFDIFAGDFRINLHDRFTYYQNPLQQGAISSTNIYGGTNSLASRFGTAQNTAGIAVDWDLNKLLVSFGLDHVNSFATSSDFSYIDQTSEYAFVRIAYLMSQGVTLGVEVTGGMTDYDQPVLNDNTQLSAGPFVTWQLSRYLSLSTRGGYVTYSFDPTGIITNATDTSSFYASISVDHIMNKYLSHSLGAGYQVSLGVNSDAVKLSFIRHVARWQIVRNTDISTEMFFEHGEETGSLLSETFDRFGISLGMSYQISSKLGSGFRYSYTSKDSDRAGRGYAQNAVSLNFSYRF